MHKSDIIKVDYQKLRIYAYSNSKVEFYVETSWSEHLYMGGQ